VLLRCKKISFPFRTFSESFPRSVLIYTRGVVLLVSRLAMMYTSNQPYVLSLRGADTDWRQSTKPGIQSCAHILREQGTAFGRRATNSAYNR
jgi:hypothetical protein